MLALIAGQGALPGLLVTHLNAAGQMPLIVALDGHAPATLTPDITFRIETLGTLLLALADRGVKNVCFAGAIARPALDAAAIDAATMPLVPVMMQAMQQGDDGALRAVLGIFEDKGFTIRTADEILPALLPPAGVATKLQPDAQDRKNTIRGAEIVAAMGAVDVGQSCVVARGQAQAIEAQPGTDHMLRSLRSYEPRSPGGLLFKAPKPDQDRRIDLPVIGTKTVANAAGAGLGGIVIEAGGVMVPDWPAVVAACDQTGLFLWVRERDR